MARPRSDIRPRLLEAARARFLADGVDGASLREIARDAKTNLGMIVYYFPTKDDLFFAVIEETYASLTSELETILRAKKSTHDRLHAGFVRLGTASERELDVMRLLAREALSSSERRHRIVERFLRGHLPILFTTLAEAVRAGEFDATLPAPFLALAVMGLGGMPQLFRRAMGDVPAFGPLPEPDALAELSLDVLQRAIGAPKPPTATKPGSAKRRSSTSP
jgi:AcrR family transcriptional regulator